MGNHSLESTMKLHTHVYRFSHEDTGIHMDPKEYYRNVYTGEETWTSGIYEHTPEFSCAAILWIRTIVKKLSHLLPVCRQ
jgi:hypothetical protein